MKCDLSCLVPTFSFRFIIGMSQQRRILIEIHSLVEKATLKKKTSRPDTNHEEKSSDTDEPFVEP